MADDDDTSKRTERRRIQEMAMKKESALTEDLPTEEKPKEEENKDANAAAEAGPEAPFLISRRPENLAFDQQKLKAWQVLLTPKWVIPLFIALGLLFLPLGRWLQIVSDAVVEYRVQYDGDGMDVSSCAISSINEGRVCQVTISVKQEMKAPVYVLYEVQNFHQNHQKYLKSVSSEQMLGANLDESQLGDCAPLKTNGSKLLSPCGLIANTMFNDVFEVVSAPKPFDTNVSVPIVTSSVSSSSSSSSPAPVPTYNKTITAHDYMLETGISWPSDRKDRFVQPQGFAWAECDPSGSCNGCLGGGDFPGCKDYTDPITQKTYKFWYPGDDDIQYLYESYPDTVSPLEGVLNEHFIVWMRTAALPSFRKLYGRIEYDIPGDSEITFEITSNFMVSTIDATKSIVLTTTSDFGGKNVFLGLAYMFVGALCLAVGSVFLVKQLRSPRPFGDQSLLVWD